MNEIYDLLHDVYENYPYCFCNEKKKSIHDKIMVEINKILSGSLNDENDELYQMINYTSLKTYPLFSIMYDKLLGDIINTIEENDSDTSLESKIYDMLKMMISSLTRYDLVKFTTIEPTINNVYTDKMIAFIIKVIKQNTTLTILNNYYDLLPINLYVCEQFERLKYIKTLYIIKH